MSSDQPDPNGPRIISRIPSLNHILLHKGYWLAASQASIQSLYTSTASDRSEEQCVKDEENLLLKILKMFYDGAGWYELCKSRLFWKRYYLSYSDPLPLLMWYQNDYHIKLAILEYTHLYPCSTPTSRFLNQKLSFFKAVPRMVMY